MPKRKQSAVSDAVASSSTTPLLPAIALSELAPAAKRRKSAQRKPGAVVTNPDESKHVVDGPNALRASPDGEPNSKLAPNGLTGHAESDSPLSDAPFVPADEVSLKKQKKSTAVKRGDTPPSTPQSKASSADTDSRGDPEAEDADLEADPEEVKRALSRPPPVNSSYLPLPWKGRLGYACLNTYLRYSNPPTFCSRTTRIASILEHRHPLADPGQPEHATKNRPDKEQPADKARGQAFVEQLCLANVRDMKKLIRWNERYGIKFMRLSSEAFPFASHAEYGYKLAPFAADSLAGVGKVAAQYGHRLTVHPGQFTQLGSPRPQVIEASIRDLEYHEEMLSLLKLPEQQDRDAVMILHMGGIYGDKESALNRFRENYAKLSPAIKKRLVLENDDVCYTVHDLLPICQELNIPLVLDFHHHNILFDSDKIREGTKDIMELYPQIIETWSKKGITPKMHYSEQTPAALTPKQRRKHNPRPATLPPCPQDMDLMIEAKDKEQAVLELMRTFKLPGHDLFNDIIPHVRSDDNKVLDMPSRKKKATPKKKGKKSDEEDAESSVNSEAIDTEPARIPEEDIGMGGPQGRVYWPPGMEEWLRPQKRVVKKKETEAEKSFRRTAAGKRAAAEEAAATAKTNEAEVNDDKAEINGADGHVSTPSATPARKSNPKSAPVAKKSARSAPKKVKKETPTPVTSDEESAMDVDGEEAKPKRPPVKGAASSRKSSRAKAATTSYAEEEDEDGDSDLD